MGQSNTASPAEGTFWAKALRYEMACDVGLTGWPEAHEGGTLQRDVGSPPHIPHTRPGKTCWENISGRGNGMCKGPEVVGNLAHSEVERRSVRLLQSERREKIKFRDTVHITLDP